MIIVAYSYVLTMLFLWKDMIIVAYNYVLWLEKQS